MLARLLRPIWLLVIISMLGTTLPPSARASLPVGTSVIEAARPDATAGQEQDRPAAPTQLPTVEDSRRRLSFISRRGQKGFQIQDGRSTLFFTPDSLLLSLPAPEGSAAEGTDPKDKRNNNVMADGRSSTVVRVRFEGTAGATELRGDDQQRGVVNFLSGTDRSKWQTNLPTYAGLTYRALYPGIDLSYEGSAGQIKGTYLVAAGADPGRIRWSYQGAAGVEIHDATGDLIVTLPTKSPDRKRAGSPALTLTEQAPVAWQDIAGQRVPVEVRYTLAANGQVGFAVGAYDRAAPLTIDPTLVYGGFLGGGTSGSELSTSAVVDSAGNLYLTGYTDSGDFPTSAGAYDRSYNGNNDIFVSKLNADGTLAYSTLLGGSGGDYSWGLALDSAGNLYLTGDTASGDFPLSVDAYDTSHNGGTDAFVARLNASGTLVYSTFLGGSSDERAWGLALDSTGNLYLIGETLSSGYPTTAGAYDTSFNGDTDAFVTKLSASGALAYSTFLGGSSGDYGQSLSIDSAGDLLLTGYTSSSGYPTTAGAYDTSHNGGLDTFVTRLSASGTLDYSTFLGGSGDDYSWGQALDSTGNLYLTGYTSSSGYPTTAGAYDTSFNGITDAFVTKVSATGVVSYSTFLGGTNNDFGRSISLDGAGNLYLAGYTNSSGYPTTAGAYDTSHNGGSDAFVTKLSASGTLDYSTFLGGSSGDQGRSIGLDSAGNIYLVGDTGSSEFPTTAGAYDTSYNGSSDAFITKLSASGTLAYSTFLGGSIVSFGDDDSQKIVLDSAGNIYLTGDTQSSGYPTTAGAYDSSYNGGADVYVTRLGADGTLAYSTFFGGSGSDYGRGIVLDSAGNIYLTGETASADFPTTAGAYDTSYNGGTDAFAIKLSASGTLAYSTFLGGSSGDYARGIAVDQAGAIYLVGDTLSSGYPTTAGAYDTSYNGGSDAFITRLSASGALAYSTFLGGSSVDYGRAIALDSSGNVYLTGQTMSSGYPTTVGAHDTSYNFGTDAFITKLSATGVVSYSTFLGGSSGDYGRALALDSSGNIYLTGETMSSSYPTTAGAYDTSYNSGTDAFVTKLNASGTLAYSTFLGGSSGDYGRSIALDSSGNVYLTGETVSSGYPTTTSAYDTSHNGGTDAFVTKLSAGGGLAYSTFLGGSYDDYGRSIAVQAGMIYLTGQTGSTDFPVVGGWDASHNGGSDVFIVKLGDTQPPAAPTNLHATATTTTTLDLAWDAATDDTGVTSYQIAVDGVVAGSTSGTTLTLAGLMPGTTYTITVRAKDAAGNLSPASTALVIATPAIDTQPPTAPADLHVTGQTDTSISLAWDAATDNVAVAAYAVYAGAELAGTTAGTTLTLTGLTPHTTYQLTVLARDSAGNQSEPSAPVTVTTSDTQAPGAPTDLRLVGQSDRSVVLAWEPPSDVSGLAGYEVTASPAITVSSALTTTVVLGLTPATSYTFTVRAIDTAGNYSAAGAPLAVTTDAEDNLPDDPDLVAPPIAPGAEGDIAAKTAFLYTGPNPIQTGVVSITIDSERVAILRGVVQTTAGDPLPGARISVLDHPEYGSTLSRADGVFDLAVNGGEPLTIVYDKAGYLTAQRQITPPQRDFAWLPDVALVAAASTSTTVTLDGSGSSFQVAQGSLSTDADGSRQATVLFPPETTALMRRRNGQYVPIETLSVRITEYTVGPAGEKAMPAALPNNSGYTYAVDLSVLEAEAVGATEVRFTDPLPIYVDNFLEFPVGEIVPAGYYDRELAQWVASKNGRVVKIVAIVSGKAQLDADGDGDFDSADSMRLTGLTEGERTQIATLYSVGDELWRVPVEHFTPWDFNWPFGPPPDAIDPNGGPPESFKDSDDPCQINGSIIECDNQTLGELLDISGTPFQFSYRSDRVAGRTSGNTTRIPVSGPAALPTSLQKMAVSLEIEGRRFVQEFTPASSTTTRFAWDGRGAYGYPVAGVSTAKIAVSYHYPLVYYPAEADFIQSFSRSGGAVAIGLDRTTASVALTRQWSLPIDARPAGSVIAQAPGAAVWTPNPPPSASRPQLPNEGSTALGGWTFTPQHRYDPTGKILYLGDGTRQSADGMQARVLKLLAGTGTGTPRSGDGLPAIEAMLNGPRGILIASDGSIYIADTDNQRIRKIGTDGIITTVAGDGQPCDDPLNACGDGDAATDAQLAYPADVALDAEGNLYIADTQNYRVRRVDASTGIITTVAGSGEYGGYLGGGGGLAPELLGASGGGRTGPRSIGQNDHSALLAAQSNGDGGPAIEAALSDIMGLAIDSDGNLYIADTWSGKIRRVDAITGIITTVAGRDLEDCFSSNGCFEGDGGPATDAFLDTPMDVVLDAQDQIWIADSGNNRIRLVDATGVITTVVGTGGFGENLGDGGPATAAEIDFPNGIALAADGTLYIADTGSQRVRRVDATTGIITTVAGTGYLDFNGDGLPATLAALGSPAALAVAANGDLLISDHDNQRIRRIDGDGVIMTVAGNGQAGYDFSAGDGTPATSASLDTPSDVVVAPDGSTYIADTNHHRIRRVDPDGTITTVAGTGEQGYTVESGTATQLQLDSPQGIALDAQGNLYIADTGNNLVWRVTQDGQMRIVAGGGWIEQDGHSWPSITVALHAPVDVAVAPDGTFYIAEAGKHRISAVGPDWYITTIMGDGTAGQCFCSSIYGPQPAAGARLNTPSSIAVDQLGRLYIADTGNDLVLRVAYGKVEVVAGGGSDYADRAYPISAALDEPTGVAVIDSSRVLIVERGAERVRILIGSSSLDTLRGMVTGPNGQVLASDLAGPRGAAADARGNLVIADTGNQRVLREEPALPGYSRGGYLIPSRDGREVYQFSASGQHLRTIDALTNVTLYTFGYDSVYRLARITDANGLVTRITYTWDPRVAVIIGPYGQRTTLTMGANGYLASIANPASETTQFTYSEGGLLASMTSPRGGVTEFEYDDEGRLIRDTNPVGGFTELARTEAFGNTHAYTVTTTNALAHSETISVRNVDNRTAGERTSVAANGATSHQSEALTNFQAGQYSRRGTYVDPHGITTVVDQIPDPRWGMAVPWPADTSLSTPGEGTFSSMQVNRLVTLANQNNPLTLLSQQETVTVNGRTVTTSYDAGTRTLTVIEPAGRETVVTLDLAGRPISEESTGRAPKVYTYDLLGRLIRVTEGEGGEARTATMAYSPQGYLERMIDPLGNLTRYESDAAGRVVRQILPAGQTLTFAYDADGNLVRETNPQGVATTYEYDLHGRRTAMVFDPDGRAVRTEYTYDLADNLIEVVEDAGSGRANDITTYTYTPIGAGWHYALKTATNPLGETAIYTYTIAGDLASYSDALGHTTAISYTEQGWPTAVTTPGGRTTSTTFDDDGRPLIVTDPRGGTTAYTYDAAGRLEQILAGTTAVAGQPAVNQATAFAYNVHGQITSLTDGRGKVTTRDYDSFGRLVAETDPLSNTVTFTYDALDRVVERVVGGNVITEALTTRYSYDALGRLLSERVDPDGANLTTTYRYTRPAGSDTWNLQELVDPQGNLTRYSYNTLGLLDTTTDAAGQTWSYVYDNLGRLTGLSDPLSRTTSYTYNPLGQLLNLTHAGRTESWSYAQDGTLLGFTDFAGRATSFAYDTDQRLVEIDYADSTPDVGFVYDDAGNLTSMTDGLGTTIYTYDVLNRLKTRARDARTVTYSYDQADQVTQIGYWGQGTVDYTYDDAGRLESMEPWGAAPTGYTYRSTGLPAGQARPNGVTTGYRYDRASRLIGMGHTRNGTTLLDLSYTLDKNGNRTQISELGPTSPNPLVTTLQYDGLDRLTRVSYPAIPSGPNAETVNYGYDPVGNRTTLNGATQFTYDASDRITNPGYQYDANGNLLSDGATTYEYDAANRLIRSTAQGIVTNYGYDGHGNLIRRTANGITTEYVLDEGGDLPVTLGEIRSDGSSVRYAYGLEGIAAQQAGGGTITYPLLDAQGSLRDLTNTSGQSLARRNYDAFGQARFTSGTWQGAFGFTGQQDDNADGTVYLRARAYSPALGRFLQRDSFGGYATAPQTLNRYAYAGNNPANFTDLSGHDFWEDAGRGLGWLNERVGPEAMRNSWEWSQRVGRRVYNDPSILWRLATSPCVLDAVQEALDIMGMVPGAGAPFDVLNAFISAARGNHFDAALRLAFALPGAGDVAAGAYKAFRKAPRLAGEGGENLLRRMLDSCSINSFSGDTLVATPDGDVPISEIQVGDQVLAYNQETGTTGTYTVTDVIVHEDPATLHLTIDGEQLQTTPEHPFYVLLRGWVAAGALREGDQVRRADSSYGAVEALTLDPAPRLMYNLTVAEAHTFFVGDGQWLVHNDCDKVIMYRVEGTPNQRFTLDANGDVSLIPDKNGMLFVGFDPDHALYYLQKKIDGKLSGAHIKFFEVDRDFLDALRLDSVSQSLGKSFPDRPQLSDINQGDDLYGIPSDYFEALQRAIKPGTGDTLFP